MNEYEYQKKLNIIIEKLPLDCRSFFLDTDNNISVSTRYSYATEIKWFFKYLIDEKPEFAHIYETNDITAADIRKITPADISAYLLKDKKNGKTVHTTNRRRSALFRFFEFLISKQIIGYNPVREKIEPAQKETGSLYMDALEQKRFLASIESGYKLNDREKTLHARYKTRDVALVGLLLDTGIKVSELRNLNIKNINFNDCSLQILGRKNRHIYISDNTLFLLQKYIEEKKKIGLYFTEDSPVFTTLKGTRLSIRAIQVLIQKYASPFMKNGEKITPQKLRASFAIEYLDTTKNTLALQKIMGYNNLTSTSTYARIIDQRMQDIRNVMTTKTNDKSMSKEQVLNILKEMIINGDITKDDITRLFT